MVLQLVSEFIYLLVEQSWLMATILVKYFLIAIGVKIGFGKKFDLEHISEKLTEHSGELVSFTVFLGLVNVFAGLSIEPVFKTFSQVIAFVYFAFLFWKY